MISLHNIIEYSTSVIFAAFVGSASGKMLLRLAASFHRFVRYTARLLLQDSNKQRVEEKCTFHWRLDHYRQDFSITESIFPAL